MTDDDKPDWRMLCGLAVELCGSQAAFRKEANVLKRLVKKYGPVDVERAIQGAKHLHWSSLLQIGDADGAGWRWAIEAYWQHEKKAPLRMPEKLRDIFRKMTF